MKHTLLLFVFMREASVGSMKSLADKPISVQKKKGS